MAKITNVMIKDHNTLIINQEAKPGDEIDLLSINSIDTSVGQVQKVEESGVIYYNIALSKGQSIKRVTINGAKSESIISVIRIVPETKGSTVLSKSITNNKEHAIPKKDDAITFLLSLQAIAKTAVIIAQITIRRNAKHIAKNEGITISIFCNNSDEEASSLTKDIKSVNP